MINITLSGQNYSTHQPKKHKVRLGVNIDHVATIRNARGGKHPSPVLAATIAEQSGANGITIHLREDRRHIVDSDLMAIKKAVQLPINLEIAITGEMVAIAINFRPHSVCIVPEKRQELTTEGGLKISLEDAELIDSIQRLQAEGILVSLFIDPDLEMVKIAKTLGVDIVELHSGKYCEAFEMKDREAIELEFKRIHDSAKFAKSLDLICHAGHGLNYQTAKNLAEIEEIIEFNIGHFLIGEAINEGLAIAIKKMQEQLS